MEVKLNVIPAKNYHFCLRTYATVRVIKSVVTVSMKDAFRVEAGACYLFCLITSKITAEDYALDRQFDLVKKCIGIIFWGQVKIFPCKQLSSLTYTLARLSQSYNLQQQWALSKELVELAFIIDELDFNFNDHVQNH